MLYTNIALLLSHLQLCIKCVINPCLMYVTKYCFSGQYECEVSGTWIHKLCEAHQIF